MLGDRVYCVDDGAKIYAFDAQTGDAVGKPEGLDDDTKIGRAHV